MFMFVAIAVGVGLSVALFTIFSAIAVTLARRKHLATAHDVVYSDDVDGPLGTDPQQVYAELERMCSAIQASNALLRNKMFASKQRYPEIQLMKNTVLSLRKGNSAIQNLILNLGLTKYEATEHPQQTTSVAEETQDK